MWDQRVFGSPLPSHLYKLLAQTMTYVTLWLAMHYFVLKSFSAFAMLCCYIIIIRTSLKLVCSSVPTLFRTLQKIRCLLRHFAKVSYVRSFVSGVERGQKKHLWCSRWRHEAVSLLLLLFIVVLLHMWRLQRRCHGNAPGALQKVSHMFSYNWHNQVCYYFRQKKRKHMAHIKLDIFFGVFFI